MKDQPRISAWTKSAYGIGSVAYGIKNNGFDYFFLIFYSQVMGVDAGLVGLALMLALAFDAISDPLVGYLSDNTHTSWGRRHPFMYAAALPAAIGYAFIWNPPAALQGNELFWYITLLAIFAFWAAGQAAISLGLVITNWAMQGIITVAALIIIIVFRNEISSVLLTKNFKSFLWDA